MSRPTPHPDCDRWAPLLEAYVDGEVGDPAEAAALAEHLEDCTACRAEHDALISLSRGLAALGGSSAPDSLREAVRSRLFPQGYQATHYEQLVRVMNHPALALGAAILAGVLIGTAWQLYANHRAEAALRSARPVAAVPALDEHISLVQSDEGSSLQTRDPAALETWLRERLDFSPPVPAWSWAELAGGRVCVVGGRRVARIQYRVAGREFTLFVQPAGPNDAHVSSSHCNSGRRAAISQQRGYKAAFWSREGFDYVLVAHQTAESVFENLKNEP